MLDLNMYFVAFVVVVVLLLLRWKWITEAKSEKEVEVESFLPLVAENYGHGHRHRQPHHPTCQHRQAHRRRHRHIRQTSQPLPSDSSDSNSSDSNSSDGNSENEGFSVVQTRNRINPSFHHEWFPGESVQWPWSSSINPPLYDPNCYDLAKERCIGSWSPINCFNHYYARCRGNLGFPLNPLL